MRGSIAYFGQIERDKHPSNPFWTILKIIYYIYNKFYLLKKNLKTDT